MGVSRRGWRWLIVCCCFFGCVQFEFLGRHNQHKHELLTISDGGRPRVFVVAKDALLLAAVYASFVKRNIGTHSPALGDTHSPALGDTHGLVLSDESISPSLPV